MFRLALFLTVLYVVYADEESVNFAPRWIDGLERLWAQGIREDTPPGRVLGRLVAVDPENDPITYAVSFNQWLEVNEATGEVTLKTALDREARQYLPVNFYALDAHQSASSIDFDIVVTDVNDNAPSFQETPYTATVGEHATPGSIIFPGILARDLDAGGNAQMDLDCYDDGTEESMLACSTFSVKGLPGRPGILQGAVTLKTPLDYETHRSYALTVRVRDRGHPSLTSLVTIPISVEDSQDLPPKFLNAPITLHVTENTPAGTSVGVVRAQDQDMGNPSALQFRINDDPLRFFALESAVVDEGGYKATIVVQRPVDREHVGNSYGFTVEAMERVDDQTWGLMSHTVVTVAIDDVNDFAPRFSSPMYEVDVPEDMQEGASLGTLYMLVNDEDGAGNNKYDLELQGDEDGVWQLSSQGGEGWELFTLTLVRPEMIDFEVPENRQRTLEVVARERQTAERFSSTATVILSVFDVDDNEPKFPRDAYTLTGQQAFGDQVGVVTASDVDSGSNGLILYQLQGDDSEYFQVDRYSGELRYVGPSSDTTSATSKTYHMTLVARDPAGHEATTRLSVEMDAPSTAVGTPTLYSSERTTTVISGSSALEPPVFLVSSQSGNGLVFNIVSGNTATGAFQVNPTTSELYLRYPVTYSDAQDGIGDMFLLRIEIKNTTTGITNSVYVQVHLTELNIYAPQFSQTTYTTSILETAPPGFSVLVVRATDQDRSSVPGSVTYTMQGGTALFQLDTVAGVLSVRPGADLASHATADPYRFLVMATDTGSPPRTGTAEVVVTITDVNNQSPTFSQTKYFGSVNQGAASGTSVLQVVGRDMDSANTLTYKIRPGTFTAWDGQRQQVSTTNNFNYVSAFMMMSTTGEVRTVPVSLQPDQVREVQFLVEVTDNNASPSYPGQTATATAIVYIVASDVQHITLSPVFVTSIHENQEVGSDLLILATSSDAQVTFSKVLGTDAQGYFNVHSYTGKVTLARSVDYEQLNPPELICQIQAATASSTAFTTLKVTVVNDNDNVPSFLQTSYSFEVPASLAGGALIGIILATDGDRGNYGDIVYSISGPTSNQFRIDPNTGHLTLAPGGSLNAVSQPFHQLTVEATDDPGGSTSQSYGTRINITVFDDNYAVLSAAEYQAVVSDSTLANSALLTVSLQLPEAAFLVYHITSGNSHDLFRIDSSSGTLYTTQSLAGYASPSPYQLTVRATSPTDSQRSNSTLVTLWVLSASPGSGSLAPMFLSPSPSSAEVQILEELPAGSRVLTVLAYSPSTASALGVTYRLLPQQDHSYFSLDTNTGLLTTAQRLDRETKDRFQVDIEARYDQYTSQQTLAIALLDQDDHEPTFTSCPGYSDPRRVSVTENLPAGTLVTVVTACDADIYPNNLTYFYIVCGNDPSLASEGLKPFRLDSNTGRLLTEAKLDREQQAEYQICIKVVPSPGDFNPTGSETFESTAGDATILRYIVNVADQDDNLPTFGYQNATYAAVQAEAPFHTAVVQIQAYDLDSDVIQYSLEPASEMRFHPDSGGSQAAQDTFTIDYATGVVYTNLVHYLNYNAGYFSLPIRATTSGSMTAASTLVIYLIRSAQLMRFTFDKTPEEVVETQSTFTSAVSNELNAHISVSSIRYHIVDGGGRLDFAKSDMCFHVINKNSSTVLEPLAVEALFRQHEQGLEPIYNMYGVDDDNGIQSCDVRVTTIWWSGYWYLWWILVALAILLILLALICMVCLANKHKKAKKELPYKPYKPYTMLDPFVVPYEYEETTVHM